MLEIAVCRCSRSSQFDFPAATLLVGSPSACITPHSSRWERLIERNSLETSQPVSPHTFEQQEVWQQEVYLIFGSLFCFCFSVSQYPETVTHNPPCSRLNTVRLANPAQVADLKEIQGVVGEERAGHPKTILGRLCY